MKAVAMITPDPKYFANLDGEKPLERRDRGGGGGDAYSKTLWGRVTRLERWAMIGKVAPKVLQTQMMKTEAMRRPV